MIFLTRESPSSRLVLFFLTWFHLISTSTARSKRQHRKHYHKFHSDLTNEGFGRPRSHYRGIWEDKVEELGEDTKLFDICPGFLETLAVMEMVIYDYPRL
jgi:hypothetical protein